MSHRDSGGPRVAVLYSGRMFGSNLIGSWAANHLETLIKPNRASVFVVSDATTWCSAPKPARELWRAGQWAKAEALLRAQVSEVFQHYPKLYVALASTEDLYAPHAWGKAAVEAMRRQNVSKADRAAIFIHKWFSQYDHYAKAEALRMSYGPHDVRNRPRVHAAEPLMPPRCALPAHSRPHPHPPAAWGISPTCTVGRAHATRCGTGAAGHVSPPSNRSLSRRIRCRAEAY